MDNIVYKNKSYTILESLVLNNETFVICIDKDNKVSYFKETKVHDYKVYTPLDKLMKVLPQYQTDEIVKEQKVLNILSRRVEKRYNGKNVDKVKSKISGFSKYAKRKKMKINADDIAWYMGGLGRFRKLTNVYVIIMLVSMIGLVTCGFTLVNWYSEGKNVHNTMADVLDDIEITEEYAFESSDKTATFDGDAYLNQKYGSDYWKYAETTMMNVDFSNLLNINPDTVGWIYINDTNVNYPFVQGEDNSFYLKHSFDKNYNVAGWLFADYRSDFNKFKKNSVIYGHGRVDQVMFGSLDKVLNEEWYKNADNQIIKISTPKKNTLWKIVSIYTIPSESYYLTHTFLDDESYQKFIDTMLGRSIYDFGEDVTVDDKLLTLSTCLDTNGNRIVVQAKLVLEEKRK